LDMNWESPIKVARLCFHETGNIVDHFMSTDDPDAVDRLIAFLRESKALIVGLEHFAEAEIQRLRNADGQSGRSLFSLDGCYGNWDSGLRQRCLRLCPLRLGV
jgi:hypothetical protein